MSLYDEAVPQLTKMLGNLDRWLTEAEEAAEARGYEADVLLTTRLYPDMFPLTRQIQSACDTAKFVGSRLSETDAPKHDDTETTFAELHTRIAETIAFLGGLDRAAFDGSESRDLFLGFLRGGSVTGLDYVREFALPNFYFHASMAYAILRTNGVKLGKQSFIGAMNVKMPS